MGQDTILLPSALISCTGMQNLTVLEQRLLWKIIEYTQTDNVKITNEDGIILKILAIDLQEDGETDRRRLAKRLDNISQVSFTTNLDGRDKGEIWRIKLRPVSEYEINFNDAFVHINIGTRFYQALNDKKIYAKIKASALFSMKSSKYSSRLYTIIRDKINQKNSFWSTSVDNLKLILQVRDNNYKSFSNFRQWVLEPAINEINNNSELDLTWRKSLQLRAQVLEITFDWKLKNIIKAKEIENELKKHSISRGKKKEIILTDDDLEHIKKAISFLDGEDAISRMKLAKRFVELGLVKEQMAMSAKENLHKWVNLEIANQLRDDGFI